MEGTATASGHASTMPAAPRATVEPCFAPNRTSHRHRIAGLLAVWHGPTPPLRWDDSGGVIGDYGL